MGIVTTPVFASFSAAQGVLPMLVEVTNKGPAATGVVRLNVETRTLIHPIELPQGSKKEFITYVPLPHFSDVRVELDTNEGEVFTIVPAAEPRGIFAFGLIGGSVGDLTFMRVGDERSYLDVTDAYGKPGKLPDRAAGYSSFRAVVLGDGAERMSDDEISAIKTWIIAGGTLFFIGGSNTTVIEDSRWSGFLPIGKISRKNVPSLARLDRLGGSPPPAGSVSLAIGQPLEESKVESTINGEPVVVSKRAGLGKCVYLAFDPFESPLRQWKGNKKLFERLSGHERWESARTWALRQSISSQVVSTPMGAPLPASEETSPFTAKLPPAGTVLLILLLHMIIAVPLNFLVMRRIGRSELAWVTTPIVSVAFAAVFFSFAAGLYQSGQTTRTRGVLFASYVHPEGYFKGISEVFIPRGGSYDLQLKNVELIEDVASDYTRPNTFAAVDDGKLNVPALAVPNLAFREFLVEERVDVKDWLEIRLDDKKDGTSSCAVVNKSPYLLANVSLHFGSHKFAIGDVRQGESIEKTVRGVSIPWVEWADPGQVVLHCYLRGFRAGAQIGDDADSKVQLVYYGGSPR